MFDPVFVGARTDGLDCNNLPLAPGVDVLGGIARGLNTIQWQVLIFFQPPDVWQRKGLVSFKLVHKVTGMAMRDSGEEKTAFVYVATSLVALCIAIPDISRYCRICLRHRGVGRGAQAHERGARRNRGAEPAGREKLVARDARAFCGRSES